MNDLDIIKQLEQEIGKKLEKYTKIEKVKETGYALNENDDVIQLNLSECDLSVIPNILFNLKKLESLYLIGNKIAELPESFGQLQNLSYLYLDNNQLQELPASFGQLQNLSFLVLENNQLQELPASFGQLQNLSVLSLGDNQLQELPAWFGQLQNLSELYLQENQLQELPAWFGQLQNLSYLYLSNNQLQELPASFGQLQNLSELHLQYNQLQELPASFGQLKNSCQLSFFGNPLKTPPLEIAEKGIEAIGNYFAELDKDLKLPLNEAKILIVGQGGVGKTSLVNRLISNTFDDNENKTDGINIQNWQVKIKSQQIRLNVWDFGGQEIMHATHQFFLTKRSLYLLVLDARQEEQYSRVEYWLKMTATYGDESPVLVILNKSDQHQSELSEAQLKRDYPNIKGFYSISCKDNDNIQSLKQHIFSCIDELPHIHDLLPKTWFDIKNKLENMRRDFIPYSEYEKICNRANINASSQITLIDFLHDLGIALNYRDDKHLKETNILNPEWITEGIYKIINSNQLFQAKGKLKLDDLKQILDLQKYPNKKHEFILKIMQKFELCFEFPTEDKFDYLVPDLLSKQEPYLNWSEEDSLRFELHYDVLPNSIISRFIVRNHRIALNQTYWRTGIVIKQDNNQALIIANLETKKIAISVTGMESGRRGLLTTVRKGFDDIHDSMKGLKLTEKVRYRNVLIPFQHLLKAEKVGEKTYFIPELEQKADLTELLNGFDIERKNYSNDDENKPMNLPENKSPIWTQDKIVMAVIAALALIATVSTSIAIWKGLETPEEPPAETCTHSVMLYDKNTNRTVKKDATVYFLYQNDKYTFHGDSEGFYKASLACDKNNADGKIHVEATGYEVYERNFKLDSNMQEIRLIPE